MNRLQWMLATALVAFAGLAGWWFGDSPSPPPPLRVNSQSPEHASLTVHVAGEVASPGLVTVPAGSRVADAIAASGGLLGAADTSALNLAAPLVDGQQVIVRPYGQVLHPLPDEGVRLNTASAEELEAIPGVGPVLAARIVSHRRENGPFAVVEDLLDVAGIGEAKLAALRDSVVVP